MTEEFLLKIVSSLGLCSQDVLKPKHGNSVAITAISFLQAVMATESIPEAAKVLGTSSQTLNRLLTKHFVPAFGNLNGGNETWKLRFLDNAGLKRCSKCRTIHPHKIFDKDVSNFDGLYPECKSCRALSNKAYYEKHKEKYHRPYIETHKAEYAARNAKRRAQKLLATPAWADLEKIKQVYVSCPKGCHVDHIYPLISDWVCGLHVHENLQHLSAEDNLRKGNKRLGDW